MAGRIREIPSTVAYITTQLDLRKQTEEKCFENFMSDYQIVLTRLRDKAGQITQLSSEFANDMKGAHATSNSTKMKEIQDELHSLYKRLTDK